MTASNYFQRNLWTGTDAERLAQTVENGAYWFCTDTLRMWQYVSAWYLVSGTGGGTLLKNAVIDAHDLTTVTVFTSGVCQVHYMGMCPQACSSVNLLVNVTTAYAAGGAGTPWAEIAIYKGTPTLNGNVPDLTRLGWADVSAVYNSTGRKNTVINLATPAVPGDTLFVVSGCAVGLGGTVHQLRGGLADDIQTGMFQTITARPSTTAGPTASTLGGATAVPAWLAIKIN